MNLKQFEAIEDLGNNLRLIQHKNQYRFTTDAVLLANFVGDVRKKSVVDLGSGSGVISILLAGKKQAGRVVGVEIQPQLVDMSRRSVELNGLENVVEIVHSPMQGIWEKIGNHFDVVVCNPPYRKVGSGDSQLNLEIAICRHEIEVSLEEVVETASKLLNAKGSFFMVHQSNRIAEICCLFKKYNLEPKIILPVCPKPSANPNLVLIKGTKFGKVDCILKKPLVILTENGEISEEVKKLYE